MRARDGRPWPGTGAVLRAGAAGVLRGRLRVNMLRPPATAGWQWCARVRSFCGFVNRQSARTGPGRSRLPRRRCCYSSVSRRHRTRPAHGAVQTRGARWWWASSRGWGGRTRSLPQLWARWPPPMLPERALPTPPARGHWTRGGDRAVRGLCACSCRPRPMHARGGGRLYVCACASACRCVHAHGRRRGSTPATGTGRCRHGWSDAAGAGRCRCLALASR